MLVRKEDFGHRRKAALRKSLQAQSLTGEETLSSWEDSFPPDITARCFFAPAPEKITFTSWADCPKGREGEQNAGTQL